MQDRLIEVARSLSEELGRMRFGPPVTHVYDPVTYARASHEAYLRKYGGGTGRVLLVGMNPGPYGMAQTGVPFGEVGLVRDWMGIEAPVGRPDPEHPKRPVLGFAQTRSEVSGQRLWGWARERFGTADRFFERFFVANWCPLAFLEESGRNRTPDKLPAEERLPLVAACDAALARVVGILEPTAVIGVGTFVEQRARKALAGRDVRIGRVLHPSPASPAANQGWGALAEAELAAQGITVPDRRTPSAR